MTTPNETPPAGDSVVPLVVAAVVLAVAGVGFVGMHVRKGAARDAAVMTAPSSVARAPAASASAPVSPASAGVKPVQPAR